MTSRFWIMAFIIRVLLVMLVICVSFSCNSDMKIKENFKEYLIEKADIKLEEIKALERIYVSKYETQQLNIVEYEQLTKIMAMNHKSIIIQKNLLDTGSYGRLAYRDGQLVLLDIPYFVSIPDSKYGETIILSGVHPDVGCQ